MRIEEDIGKERTKVEELQAELREPELQASHSQNTMDHGPRSEDEMGGNVGDDEEDSDILDVGNLSLGDDLDSAKSLGLINAVILFLLVA